MTQYNLLQMGVECEDSEAGWEANRPLTHIKVAVYVIEKKDKHEFRWIYSA